VALRAVQQNIWGTAPVWNLAVWTGIVLVLFGSASFTASPPCLSPRTHQPLLVPLSKSTSIHLTVQIQSSEESRCRLNPPLITNFAM
jgi:hypothetical protein